MADDNSLLDRLNALKATSVRLDKEEPKLSLSAISTAPITKEDALSARLRSLRNASASPRSPAKELGSSQPDTQTQPQVVNDNPASPLDRARTPHRESAERQEDAQGDAYDEPLFHADDSTLDELLESLDLSDDVSLDGPPPLGYDARDEEKKVAALLDELGKPATDPSSQDRDDEDDDDSDGEAMTARVNEVLSRALDEAELDRSLNPQEADRDVARDTAASTKPGPPSQPDSSPFSLPTVPSQLVDPVPAPRAQPTDFESSIAARMAALKGVSYGTDSASDTFGLPQAPSFDPDSKPAPSNFLATGTTVTGRGGGGYTDEDQKTWCVVCLEDATIRCVGCDGDVYCGRCWRDMHVGPRAGYDERGHRWVRFERGQ